MRGFFIKAEIYGFCDKGRVRKNNQDNLVINEIIKDESLDLFEQHVISDLPCCAGVFDGMGGTSKGEEAAYECAYISRVLPRLVCSSDNLKRDIFNYFEYVNERLIKKQIESNVKFGSTACIAIVLDSKIFICNIGDSPAFIIENKKIDQVSVNDNQAQMLVDMNVISAQQAKNHPMKNMLTQYMGIGVEIDDPKPEPHFFQTSNNIDFIIMCSDGVSGVLDIDEIKNTVLDSKNNPADELVKKALKYGSTDNATAVVIKLF